MKFVTTVLFLLPLMNSTFAQSNDNRSDLRIKVDSIIQFQIGYVIDSTYPSSEPHVFQVKFLV